MGGWVGCLGARGGKARSIPPYREGGENSRAAWVEKVGGWVGGMYVPCMKVKRLLTHVKRVRTARLLLR